MISVLVVEDNPLKIKAYQNIFKEHRIPEENVEICETEIDAKRKLQNKTYTVLVLDLVLPRRKDSEPSATGGKDLLLDIINCDGFCIPQNIFAISEYDEPMTELKAIGERINFNSIKYSQSSCQWRGKFSSYIEQIIKTENSVSSVYNYDVAIICALAKPELEQVLKLPFEWREEKVTGDITKYRVGKYKKLKLVCAASYEMGMPAASILATKMINLFHPRYIVMTGIAGGVNREKQGLGDIMIADPCFDYGNGKRIVKEGKSIFEPDYRQIRLDAGIQQIIQRIIERQDLLAHIKETFKGNKPERKLRAQIGSFGSGAAVLADPTIVSNVQGHARKIVGFDMEAYGIMLAGAIASVPKPLSIVIKSISDFGDSEKNDDYQEYAAYTSAQILPALFDELSGD